MVDARSGAAFEELGDVMAQMNADGVRVELLYLDASDGALVHRFKETRRPHPLVSEATAGPASSRRFSSNACCWSRRARWPTVFWIPAP